MYVWQFKPRGMPLLLCCNVLIVNQIKTFQSTCDLFICKETAPNPIDPIFPSENPLKTTTFALTRKFYNSSGHGWLQREIIPMEKLCFRVITGERESYCPRLPSGIWCTCLDVVYLLLPRRWERSPTLLNIADTDARNRGFYSYERNVTSACVKKRNTFLTQFIDGKRPQQFPSATYHSSHFFILKPHRQLRSVSFIVKSKANFSLRSNEIIRFIMHNVSNN